MAEQRAMTTYRLADGTLAGDFMFVTELEWFENDSEPTDLIREEWVIVRRTAGTYTPPGYRVPCPACSDDVDRDCPICAGHGVVDAPEGWKAHD